MVGAGLTSFQRCWIVECKLEANEEQTTLEKRKRSPLSRRPSDEVEIVQPRRRNSRRLSYSFLGQDPPVIGCRLLAGTRSRLRSTSATMAFPVETFCNSLESGLDLKAYPSALKCTQVSIRLVACVHAIAGSAYRCGHASCRIFVLEKGNGQVWSTRGKAL